MRLISRVAQTIERHLGRLLLIQALHPTRRVRSVSALSHG